LGRFFLKTAGVPVHGLFDAPVDVLTLRRRPVEVFGGQNRILSRAVNVRPAFSCKEYGLRHDRRHPNQRGIADSMDPHDREVLILRHKDVFQGIPGGIEGIWG
jgi:hypothetical protein